MEYLKLINQIQDLVGENKFEHYFLFENLWKIYTQKLEINAVWLKEDTNSWILGFCADNIYNIYGYNFSKELLEEVLAEMKFDRLPNGLWFSGNRQIIEYLFERNTKNKYYVFKNRYFYEVQKSNFCRFLNIKVRIREAEIKDIDILIRLYTKFNEEEYKCKNDKVINSIRNEVKSLIKRRGILVVQKDEELIGYCSKMNTKFNNEMIGTVFIDSDYRNKNYGKYILSEMTKLILLKNPKCWLMTDITNRAANKIVEGIGYSKVYEYTIGQLTKTS